MKKKNRFILNKDLDAIYKSTVFLQQGTINVPVGISTIWFLACCQEKGIILSFLIIGTREQLLAIF